MVGFAPDLEKRFLENIIRFRFLVHHAADQRAEGARVTRIQFLEGVLPALGDLLHEHFIADERTICGVQLGKNFGKYRHDNGNFGDGGVAGHRPPCLSIGRKNPDARCSPQLGPILEDSACARIFSDVCVSAGADSQSATLEFNWLVPKWIHISYQKKNWPFSRRSMRAENGIHWTISVFVFFV